ncbi:hypothetical protein [Frondihabitans cladoniiphilus]|uniref:Secreted protein n=1 Tax=Frondihabitans cladoniiphilus TaxID=715785 RepID=A0ABP8W7B6_9MICO
MKIQRAHKPLMMAVLGVIGVTALGGCSASQTDRPTPSVSAAVDPLVQIKDPSNDLYTDAANHPVLHVQGTGSRSYTLKSLPAGTTRVTFYVSCSPSSRFVVAMGKNFSGPCGHVVANSGGIPVDAATAPTVTITLPKTTSFWLVGIPSTT